jgi:hypothetical protein
MLDGSNKNDPGKKMLSESGTGRQDQDGNAQFKGQRKEGDQWIELRSALGLSLDRFNGNRFFSRHHLG